MYGTLTRLELEQYLRVAMYESLYDASEYGSVAAPRVCR